VVAGVRRGLRDDLGPSLLRERLVQRA
jgi:hypothetical protein